MGAALSHGATLRDPSTSEPRSTSSHLAKSEQPPTECPMQQRSSSDSLNPLNRIPRLSQSPSVGQKTHLSIERTTSSIPKSSSRADASSCPVAGPSSERDESNWIYPSPQQFHNALARKGKEAPEESVSMMVSIHNWLNESAWQEVRRWEEMRNDGKTPELSRFEGKPNELSPKARWHLFLSKLFPDSYSSLPPFDRHDWQVYRPLDGSLHRYVIDYYSAPDDEHGNPVFSLDVRPALDSPGAVYVRLREWSLNKRRQWFG